MTDLRVPPQLPPPRPGDLLPPAPRPGMLTAAAVATMVASLLWVCGMSLIWMMIIVLLRAAETIGDYSGLYHLLNSAQLDLAEGGAAPAYIPALGALVLGPMMLLRLAWVRIAATAWGVLAIVWGAAWQLNTLELWAPAAIYIGLVVLATWTPGVGRWYRLGRETAPNSLVPALGRARMAP